MINNSKSKTIPIGIPYVHTHVVYLSTENPVTPLFIPDGLFSDWG